MNPVLRWTPTEEDKLSLPCVKDPLLNHPTVGVDCQRNVSEPCGNPALVR